MWAIAHRVDASPAAEDALDEFRFANRRDGELGPRAVGVGWLAAVAVGLGSVGDEFQLADFAADLRLVHEGKARVEYADPSEFFARTYMTDGLTDLLTQTVLRMHGLGGDPLLT